MSRIYLKLSRSIRWLFYAGKPHDLQFMYEMTAEILSDKLMPVFGRSPQQE